MSSARPNLQNIPTQGPIGGALRTAFAAEPGWSMLSADYSQVELRILAHVSQVRCATAVGKVLQPYGQCHRLMGSATARWMGWSMLLADYSQVELQYWHTSARLGRAAGSAFLAPLSSLSPVLCNNRLLFRESLPY